MQIKKGLVLICALIFWAGTTYPNSKSEEKLKKQQSIRALAELTKGIAFKAGKENYVIMPDLTLEPLQQSTDIKGKTLRKQEWRLGKRKIVKRVENQALNNRVIYPKETLVLNQRTRRFGLMTRNITVEYISGTDVAAIAEALNLTVYKDYPHLSRVFFTIPTSMDVLQATTDLKSQKGVLNAEPEVIENYVTPQ